MPSFFNQLINRLGQIGSNDQDSEEIKLRKTLLVLSSIPFSFIGAFWGLAYMYSGVFYAGLIPFSYGIISFLSIVFFAFSRRFIVFRFIQLFLILILPFVLMLSLGGFITGSAVILWGLITPLGALLLAPLRSSIPWLIAYLILLIVSAFIQLDNPDNSLSAREITFFFILNITGVGTLTYGMFYYFVAQKNLFQHRSESLLLNILPRQIAQRLKDKPVIIADHFDHASILFADVVNFTPLSANLTPVELVKLLNELFSAFDRLVEKYSLEKIKTIGDCYMVAAGVPTPRDDHAQALVAMTLEMRNYVLHHDIAGKRLNLRYGINSGPVIAGVIGTSKFSYDVWGDTVNTASRMESHGNGGEIQITEATYKIIQHEFTCAYQGLVQVKGKGELPVWYVLGKHSH